MKQEERILTLSFCKYIDIIMDNIPWVIDNEFITKNNIDLVCHDISPYPNDSGQDIYAYCKI